VILLDKQHKSTYTIYTNKNKGDTEMEFSNRKYGVEIEFAESFTKANELVLSLNAVGINIQYAGYTHSTSSNWKMVSDGSCGYELVSPILSGEAGLQEIEKICQVMNAMDIKVNKSCGLHIHVDARDLTKTQISKVFLQYAKYEKVFDALQPKSRRESNNSFCRSIREIAIDYRLGFSKDVFATYNNRINTRYVKVNLEAYVRHSTIEFRQGAGTTNAEKITNQIVLLIGFVEKAIKSSVKDISNEQSFADFVVWLNLRKNDLDTRVANCRLYVNNRFRTLNSVSVKAKL